MALRKVYDEVKKEWVVVSGNTSIVNVINNPKQNYIRSYIVPYKKINIHAKISSYSLMA